jgi:hypothetical protein
MQSTNDVFIRHIRRIAGEAGSVTYEVEAHAQDGGVQHFTFSGNIFVGPVVLTTRCEDGQWNREVIDEPRRFGEFTSADWVSRYLQERSATSAYASD